jgi:hypothetical protein
LIYDQGKNRMSIVIWVLVIQSCMEAAQNFASVLTLNVFGTFNFDSHLQEEYL